MDISKELFDRKNYQDIYKLKDLIDAGADVNSLNKYRETPLMFAAENKCIDCIRLLLEAGAVETINQVSAWNYTALIYAIFRECDECIDLLLRSGADPNIFDMRGYSPLMHAVISSDDIFKLLIDAGANVNYADRRGDTALMIMSNGCRIFDQQKFNYLVEAGVNLNQRNNEGDTALIFACKNSCLSNIAALIERGANVNIKNHDGDSPLLIVLRRREKATNDEESARLLLEAGADLSVNDSFGNTPLILAAKKGYLWVVDALIKKNPELIDIRNIDGENALEEAFSNGHFDVVTKLIANGALYDSRRLYKRILSLAKIFGKDLIYALYLLSKDDAEKMNVVIDLLRKGGYAKPFTIEAAENNDLEALRFVREVSNVKFSEIGNEKRGSLLNIASHNTKELCEYILEVVMNELTEKFESQPDAQDKFTSALFKYFVIRDDKKEIAIQIAYTKCNINTFEYLYNIMSFFSRPKQNYIISNFLLKHYPCKELTNKYAEFIGHLA